MTADSARRRLRCAALTALVLASAMSAGTARAQTTSPAVVRPTQALAALLVSHQAFTRPDPHAKQLRRVQPKRPLTGERTVLPILATRKGTDGLEWLKVRLPGRPNSHTGWIRERKTRRSTTPWHIVVDTSTLHVTVYKSGHAVRVFEAIVGKESSPTPKGQFFVEEDVALPSDAVGAPFALALSARSNVFSEFDGGPGQIALHGLDNVGGVLGTFASHGCVRLADDTMRWLVLNIAPGVPVTIT
jgi:lipoprotein-anchoring transpeptidase ErfK/SrfK